MREVNSLYDIDGIFTNAWPPLDRPPVCYCDQCRNLECPGTPGPRKVRMKLPAARKVSRVELLRAEKDLPFRRTNATIEFTIPSVVDYEVAAMYSE
jgi:hypothetical protein